ncbi:MAG: hypothetical protein M3238_01275 [Actinomycetota bacterium]|nr:hypothetical protein [Actinomycetota bacterium]
MRRSGAMLTVPLVLLAVLSACRPDEIELAYKYADPGGETRYVMDARATARWNIGEPGNGSYHVRFEVREEIEPRADGSAVVSVTMTPVEVEEDNLLSPGSEERSFILVLGPNGEKLDVLQVDGVPATALDDDELALIGTFRPPLPLEAVGLGDTWDAQQQLSVGSVFQDIATEGVLEGLRRDDAGHRVAELSYAGDGLVSQTLRLPQGTAALEGTTRIEIDADLDIDDGVLLRVSSVTAGTFDARVVPQGEDAPIVGAVDLELELALHRVTRS